MLKKFLLRIQQQTVESFSPVDELDVLQTVQDKAGHIHLCLGNKPIEGPELRTLKEEANILSQFLLWRIMQETVKAQAVEMAVKNSTKWEDVQAGKMMLHNLGILKSIVEVINNAKIPD